MIDRTGGVDKALGVHLNKTYRINGANPDGRSARRDAVTISKFSALVERGRACAMALPAIRSGSRFPGEGVVGLGSGPRVERYRFRDDQTAP